MNDSSQRAAAAVRALIADSADTQHRRERENAQREALATCLADFDQ